MRLTIVARSIVSIAFDRSNGTLLCSDVLLGGSLRVDTTVDSGRRSQSSESLLSSISEYLIGDPVDII